MKNRNMKVIKGGESTEEKDIGETIVDLYTPLKKLPGANAKFSLSTEEKYWYKFFGDQLIATNKLTKPDLIHLHRLASSMHVYTQAEEAIRENGYYGGAVQKTPNGYYQISAHLVVRAKMLDDITQVSKHFGFSFLDRKKLNETNKSEGSQTSLFDQLNKQMSQ